MNFTSNLTATNVTLRTTNQPLLAGISIAFLIPILISIYVAHTLYKKVRYALWWNPENKNACCTLSPSVGLRVYEHVFKCTTCFPKKLTNDSSASTKTDETTDSSEGNEEKCCCWSKPMDFYKRSFCSRVWMLLLVILGFTSPIILIALCGTLIILLIHPMQIGIGVLCLSFSIILVLYSFASYYYNGWFVTPTARWCTRVACILICVYACVCAVLIEPLTFTGVSAVAMAFQMFLIVPAMYMVADSNRGIQLTFREWSDAVFLYIEQGEYILNNDFESKKGEFESPIEQLLAGSSKTLESEKKRKELEEEEKKAEEKAKAEGRRLSIHDAAGEKKWLDMPVQALLTNEELIKDVESLKYKTEVRKTATKYYIIGVLFLIGYSIIIWFKAANYWEKPLGFVTMAAVL
jgi:hypothetical protein